MIYRVAQEGLTNVARHARATHVDLRLERLNGHANLSVHDNGRGLPPDALSSSHGIRGMRGRAMLIGADLAIVSPPGRGTEVRLAIADER